MNPPHHLIRRILIISIMIIAIFFIDKTYSANTAPTPAVLRLYLPSAIIAAFLRPLLIYLIVTLMTVPLLRLRHTRLNTKTRRRWRIASALAIAAYLICLGLSYDPYNIISNPIVLLSCIIGGIARAHLSFAERPNPTTP